MRLRNPLDLVVVDRNRVWQDLREDRNGPLYRAEERARCGVEVLQELLLRIQRLAYEFPELEARSFRNDMAQGRAAFEGAADADGIRRLGRDLCDTVDQYAREQEHLIGERELELRRILGLVSVALKQFATTNDALVAETEAAAGELEQIARLDDLREIRAGLASNLTSLREAAGKARSGAAPSRSAVHEVDALRVRLSEVEEAASRDPLTGAYNRRMFDTRLSQLVEAGAPFTLLLGDLNKLKQINDTHGHAVGDECLRAMVAQLRALFRPTDLVARIGGDEFAVVVTRLTPEQVSDRLQLVFPANAPRSFRHQGAGGDVVFPLSASFGLAAYWPGATEQALYEAADRHLYAAKQIGENAVVI